MSERNASVRAQIKALYAQRHGLSYASLEYQRITKDIEVLSLQLETDYHWTATPGFWVTVVAMLAACIAAVPVVIGYIQKELAVSKAPPVDTKHSPSKQSESTKVPSVRSK